MRLAIIHTSLKLNAKKFNMDKVRKLIKEARERGARVILLPSMANLGPVLSFFPLNQCNLFVKNQAERIPTGTTASFINSMAALYGVGLIVGPIIERAGPRIFLTSLAASPFGGLTAKYRKITLDRVDEELGFSAGKSPVSIKMEGVHGIAAEGDLEQPEVMRLLSLLGVGSIIYFFRVCPSFDKRLEKLLEARSFENGVPVIAVGGAVESNDSIIAETPSYVVDPRHGIVEEIRLEERVDGGKEYRIPTIELKSASRSASERARAERVARLYVQLLRRLSKNQTDERRAERSRGRDSNPR